MAPLLASCGKSSSKENATYTLREFDTSTPTNWCPVSWEMSNDTYIPGYCELGLVDLAKKAGSEDYEFVYEMATNISDVTGTMATDTDFAKKWGISATDTGLVWEIDLNKGAKFQNGTVINADTYIESMKRMLDPKMKNYRATTYYTGDVGLAGGKAYFQGAGEHYHPIDEVEDALASGSTVVGDGDVVVKWDACKLFTDAAQLGSYGYAAFAEGGNLASYFKIGGTGANAGKNFQTAYPDLTKFSDAMATDFLTTGVATAIYGGSLDVAGVRSLIATENLSDPAPDWSTVGLLKVDDYTLRYITVNSATEFYFKTNMTSNWIFDNTLFDSLKDSTGDLVTTSYGTSLASYTAYGPYKLTSFEKNKQIKFERNTEWYGWTDGKHEGQYQATNIVMDVIANHATALLAFQKGDLDSIGLEQADMSKYGYSDYLVNTPETYTNRLIFNSNLDDLKALETAANDGKNKQILAQYDFRKAISLSIDRKQYCADATAGDEPAVGLLNSLYYYDVENDPSSVYRNTDQAKKAIVDLYGIKYGEGQTYATLDEAYKAVTGLDVAQAKALFTSAYNAAKAAGTYTDGQDIHFDIGVRDATEAQHISEQKVIEANVAAATKGTPLEGKITFTMKSYNGDVTRYAAVTGGTVEMAICAWGGAAFWPFSTMDCYVGANGYDQNEARSWDPKKTNLAITADFDGDGDKTNADGSAETLTHTYYDWDILLSQIPSEENGNTGYGTSAMSLQLDIMSALEYGMLDMYNFAVLSSIGTASLFSQKINYATTKYNIMYGYGGIRWMTFNYTDAAWAAYVSEQGGKLNYE